MKKILRPIFLPVMFLFCCCASTTVYAQTKNDFLKIYDSATIHSVGKFYIKGSNKLKFADLQNELTSPVPKNLYMKAKTDRVWGGVLTVTSIATLVTSIFVRKNNANLGNVLSGAAIVLNIGSLHFNKRSTEQTDRAIWQRNREILFGVQ